MGAHKAVLPIYKWNREKVPESLFCKSSSTANGTGWTSRNQGDNKLEAAGVGGYDTSAVVASQDNIAKDNEMVKIEDVKCEDGKYGEYTSTLGKYNVNKEQD